MSILVCVNGACILIALLLGIVCLRKGAWTAAHLSLLLLCGASALYGLAQIGYHEAGDPGTRLVFVRLGFCGAFLLLPVCANLPAGVVGGTPPGAALRSIATAVTLILIPVSFSDGFLRLDPGLGLIGRAGPLFLVSLVPLLVGGLYLFATLVRELSRARVPAVKNRIAWILVGSLLWIATVIPDVLRRLAVVDVFGGPVAAVGVMGFLLCTAYAVLRHRLLDIEIVITRGIVYSTLVPLMASLYLLVGETMEWMTANLVHSDSLKGSICCAVSVAFLFEPTKRLIQAVVDRWFIRDVEMVQRVRRVERVFDFVLTENAEMLEELQGDLASIARKVREDRKGLEPDRPGVTS